MTDIDTLARKLAEARKHATSTRDALDKASFAHQGAHEALRAVEAELDALIASKVEAATAELA